MLGKDEDIRARATLIGAEAGTLVASAHERLEDQLSVTRLWKLSGKWQADAQNRLSFDVQRSDGRADTLRFTGGWRVGEFQELLYTYEAKELKTRRKEWKLLVFQGHWDVTPQGQLAFLVGGDSDSELRFRGAFQTPSVLAKKGELRYQLGAETATRRKAREVMLFGKWKYSDKLGLSFEIEYEEGRKKALMFGVDAALNRKDSVAVKLKTRQGSPLGVELLLTRELFADGEAFARFAASAEEKRGEAGVRFRF
jgi:hypothetical protein